MTRSAVALARLAVPPDPTSDAQLLRTFVASQGEDAFAELVRRHGPMVLAVCRRVLGDAHDAEDAFQAVFLVLARKAASIREANVSGWLYGVAVRTARGVRVMRDRRKKHEQAAVASREQGADAPRSPMPTDHDTAAIIDEELAKLAAHYREAVVLCELSGLSRKQAAAELGIAEGTLSSRLATAKRKLAAALTRRGVTVPATLASLLALAPVSAALVESTAVAIRGAASSVASAAAGAVLKGMLFDQLKVAVLAAGLLLTGVCGGLAMTGSPDAPKADSPPAPATQPVQDSAAKLVGQLGSADFAEREATHKELRALGPKAEPALKAGLKSEDPEIRARCAKLLAEIRKDALTALVKGFDPKAEKQPDHPIWKRFKAVAGDTPASRELFARIIKNADWLRRLDAAEAGPEAAARQYRETLVEVGQRDRTNKSVGFRIYVWPCDTADEVAYLLFLGSYPGTASARPAGMDDDFQLFVDGENRIHFARGLELALQGKEIAPGPKNDYEGTAPLTPGTDRVFGRLLAAWTGRREVASDLVPSSLWLAARHGAKELLPLARVVAADEFVHKRIPPPSLYVAALAAVARFGTRADLPLIERHFKNEMVATTLVLEGPVPAGAKPVEGMVQVRDAAYGYALLLHGENPAEYGFYLGESRRSKTGERPEPGWFEPFAFAFPVRDDKARAAAHATAKAFLDKQTRDNDHVAPLPRTKP